MTVKITFEFDQYQDRNDIMLLFSARDCFTVLEKMRSYLRSRLKHEELTEEQYKTLEEVRIKFFELVNQYDVTLE